MSEVMEIDRDDIVTRRYGKNKRNGWVMFVDEYKKTAIVLWSNGIESEIKLSSIKKTSETRLVYDWEQTAAGDAAS